MKAAKEVVLKLNGSPLERPEIGVVRKIKSYLDSSPCDELFTSEELAKRVSMARNYIKDVATREELAGYSERGYRGKRYWGNPQAVAEFRRRVNP